MKNNWKITYFKPDRQGVFPAKDSISFAADLMTDKECGVVLYDHEGEAQRYPFSKEGQRGSLYGLKLEGKGLKAHTYNFFIGDEIITDPYARQIRGLEKWGSGREQKRMSCGSFLSHNFDWQQDHPLLIPLEDSVIYGLNVRAFTIHKSSGVRRRGTFEGIIEKIPYLKELGITAVELMPCYEYEECMYPEEKPSLFMNPAAEFPENVLQTKKKSMEEIRLNCWGFQKGFYFAPKAAYSFGKFPEISFKTMVRELHKNGIEVMMQFYFPPEIKQLYMLDVIRYWVTEYHIDGIRISGFHIPFRLFAEEPVLKNIKIWCTYLPQEDFSVISNPVYKNFIADNGGFRYDMRRFLKGDEGMLNQVLFYQKRNPKEFGVVNYLADYDGFSLYDSVCYERKHNESNGEDNRDGNDVNFTWNCGIEGNTRKKAIQELRLKQLKNAISFVLLAQGVPYLFSGDEFGNSRGGNNNCYCQDNEAGWIKWKDNQFSRELFAYTKTLIKLRRQHLILHMKEELTAIDTRGYGLPDISYHGVEAWRPDLSYISRMVGIALCGKYDPSGTGDSLYIAYNMHWEPHKMALPKLTKGRKWVKLADTSLLLEGNSNVGESECSNGNLVITVKERSVVIYKARQSEIKTSSKKRTHTEADVKKEEKIESLETF